jgi:UDP-N-acetylglucosamine 2-epimerase (non-hydrolysing)
MEELIHDKEAYDQMANAVNPYGDGTAAKQTVEAILEYFKEEQ